MGVRDWFPRLRRRNKPAQRLGFDSSQLPHWARVATAARFARYAQVLFREHFSDVSLRISDAAENTILLAEQSARQGAAVSNAQESIRRLMTIRTQSEVEAHMIQLCGATAQTACAAVGDSALWCQRVWELTLEFLELADRLDGEQELLGDFETILEKVQAQELNDLQPFNLDEAFGSND